MKSLFWLPTHLVILVFGFAAGAATTPFVPKVDLDFWNEQPARQYGNNCYNYATNRVTNSYAQPGEASNSEYAALTCSDVYEAASKDLGLEPTPYFKFNNKQEETLIALVVAPDYDYHWYRRDDNGQWTHKMGGTPATDKDDSDKKILSPETADRSDYTEFCGYFRIKNIEGDPSEQDAGYVRIGDMTDLPKLKNENQNEEKTPTPLPIEISQVEILLYSGRPNPQVALKDVLKQTTLAAGLGEIRILMDLKKTSARTDAPASASELLRSFSKLGYRGVHIHDAEGLLFPAGSDVLFKDSKLILTLPGSQPQMIQLQDLRVSELEKQVLASPLFSKHALTK